MVGAHLTSARNSEWFSPAATAAMRRPRGAPIGAAQRAPWHDAGDERFKTKGHDDDDGGGANLTGGAPPGADGPGRTGRSGCRREGEHDAP